jgi:hypothetical protein
VIVVVLKALEEVVLEDHQVVDRQVVVCPQKVQILHLRQVQLTLAHHQKAAMVVEEIHLKVQRNI